MYTDPKYSSITEDNFSPVIEISFVDGDNKQTLIYEKVVWQKDGHTHSLRYGDNPGQAAALYRLINGNLVLGDVESVQPGNNLVTASELLQVGKHPGKINITDADKALALLRSLMGSPSVVIIKHGNPSGVATDDSLEIACKKAIECDRVSSYGGCVGLNGNVNTAIAELILHANADVIVAPDYEIGVLEILARRPSLRVLRIRNVEKLAQYAFQRLIEFSSLIDGGLIVQWSPEPKVIGHQNLTPATARHDGNVYRCRRVPKKSDYNDFLFAWKVVCAMSSNAVVFVKDGATVGIGTGQQDSLTAAEVARDKAYRKLADHIALERFSKIFSSIDDPQMIESIMNDVGELCGGLIGSIMASDAFFPASDGIKVGQKEHVAGIIQPGGSINDYMTIEACNEIGIPMVFTGQRSFIG